MDILLGPLHKEMQNVQVMMVLVLNQSSCLTGSSCVLDAVNGAVGINRRRSGTCLTDEQSSVGRRQQVLRRAADRQRCSDFSCRKHFLLCFLSRK